MPLIQVDLQKQDDKKRLKNILDTIHECAVEAFEIPERDRYQIVSQHDPEEMILLDTGLGFERTKDQIVVRVTSKQLSLIHISLDQSFFLHSLKNT